MAIANVVDRGAMLWVYDEHGHVLGQVPKGDSLQGYTTTLFILQTSVISRVRHVGSAVIPIRLDRPTARTG